LSFRGTRNLITLSGLCDFSFVEMTRLKKIK